MKKKSRVFNLYHVYFKHSFVAKNCFVLILDQHYYYNYDADVLTQNMYQIVFVVLLHYPTHCVYYKHAMTTNSTLLTNVCAV